MDEYCFDTLHKIIQDENVNFFYLPQAVHKVLMHTSQIMKIKQLPIGSLSEEAQEARNKDVRNFRQFLSRKDSHVHTNQDVVRRLLVSSDPYISGLREPSKQNNSSLPDEAMNMLKEE